MTARGKRGRGRGKTTKRKKQLEEQELSEVNEEKFESSVSKGLNDIVQEASELRSIDDVTVRSDDIIINDSDISTKATGSGSIEQILPSSINSLFYTYDQNKTQINENAQLEIASDFEDPSVVIEDSNEPDLNLNEKECIQVSSESSTNDSYMLQNDNENDDCKIKDQNEIVENENSNNLVKSSSATDSSQITAESVDNTNEDSNVAEPEIVEQDALENGNATENDKGIITEEGINIQNEQKTQSVEENNQNESKSSNVDTAETTSKGPVISKSTNKMARVFIKPLSDDTTANDITEFFEAHGLKANDTYVPYKEGRSKRYGFAGFDNHVDAEKAISLTGSQIKGVKIEVTMAHDKDNSSLSKVTSILFFRNLPENYTQFDLEKLVKNYRDIRFLGTGDVHQRGIAFVEFESKEVAMKMKNSLKNLLIDGKHIGVEYGQPRNNNNRRNNTANYQNRKRPFHNMERSNQYNDRSNYYNESYDDRNFNYNNYMHSQYCPPPLPPQPRFDYDREYFHRPHVPDPYIGQGRYNNAPVRHNRIDPRYNDPHFSQHFNQGNRGNNFAFRRGGYSRGPRY